MNNNRISLTFTDDEKKQINDAITVLLNLLAPKLIALDKEDKKRLAKLSDDGIPFAEKVMHYSVSNPEFIPAYTSAAEFDKDFTGFTVLREFVRPLMQLVSNLEDTWTLCGSEADEFARLYYAMVAQGAKMGVPGAQTIYDDLKPRYEVQRANRAKQPAAIPNP